MPLLRKSGGGIFIPEVHVVGQVIPAPQTGDLLTIGTIGKITKLTYLATEFGTTQSGISIEVDGNNLTTPTTLADSSPSGISGDIGVYGGNPSASTAPSIGRLTEVTGEIIKIKKNAGNTGQNIIVSYITGGLN